MSQDLLQDQLFRRERSMQLRHWLRFLMHVGSAAAFLFVGMLAYLIVQGDKDLREQVLARARSAFQSLTLARRWNAEHQGVYVERKPGEVPAQPFLDRPDINTPDGKVLRPVHPAAMTREISQYASNGHLFTFHLSSTRPLNPANRPDNFELDGYQAFSRGASEYFAQVEDEEMVVLRYIAPLYMEESCLTCHAKQGYKLGDIRGAVSITFDISKLDKALGHRHQFIILVGVAVFLTFLGFVLGSLRRLNRQVASAQEALVQQAATDELTGLANRRHFFERLGEELSRARRYGRSMALIMLDLDRFKQVNDRRGHQAGDKVLAAVARALAAQCRSSDLLARYGGEEFVLILPETTSDGLSALAEKLRRAVAELTIDVGQRDPVMMTISLGLVHVDAGDLEQVDDNLLISCADQALYKAKELGRNRAETYSGPLCPCGAATDLEQGGD